MVSNKKNMKYFRVKIGYGKDDFISIDETELPRAIIAQGTGRVAVFKEGTVGGNHIAAIVPDYQRALGFARDYQLTGEDYGQLGSKTNEYRLALEEATQQANLTIGSGKSEHKLLEG